jgi:putative ABC transport system permease protein
LGHLLQKPMLAVGQSLAFALILFAMALIALLRGELLDNWQQQLPEQAANHFAFNIMPTERDAVAEHLHQLSPSVAHFYPMTPGRLTHVNGQPVQDRLTPDSPAQSTMQRDLNLTWSDRLPDSNEVTGGQWWSAGQQSGEVEISMEQELAERLSVQIGDQITFNIAGQVIHSRIHNLRSVDWGSMQPNFFVIFAPDSLPPLPHTWITSFYLPTEQAVGLNAFSQQFPSVSLLRIEAILNQLRSILAQVTLAIEFILLFVLAAGISVLLAGVQSTLSSRIHQGALLRALGGERKLLLAINRYEFATLGATSGLLAWLACELTSYLLYRLVFDMPWQPHPWLALLLPAGALLVLAASRLGTRSVLDSSPMRILRGV